MKERSVGVWALLGFAVTSFGGTLLHFLYDLFGKSVWIAPFSGVNESTWEHMKLLFFPMFVFALVQRAFFADRTDFWCIKLRGTLLGLLLIPILFYTYNGAIGKSPDWLNIAIFFVSAALAYLHEAKLFQKEAKRCKPSKIAFLTLCLLAFLFIAFTFFTPHINIFQDPVSGTFGI